MTQGPVNSCCNKGNASKRGFYYRRSDGQYIQRFRCKTCLKSFSQATFDPAYYQKKRHLNYKCMLLLTSSVSMRRTSIILNIHPITVARKLEYMAAQSRIKLADYLSDCSFVNAIQFDELQTIEHTKCKPLSVVLAVSAGSRKILGFKVSQMPATGYLSSISRKKYGKRKDLRVKGLVSLFKDLHNKLNPKIAISSDKCSYYEPVVKQYFPDANYTQFKGKKGAVYGQGELKKTSYDPLFYINHTFAMLRSNINRLIRKTWCTTKKVWRLVDHLSMYMWVHNTLLTAK